MSTASTVACKACKNVCRLVISGVLTVDPMDRLEAYNLWQCDECGMIFRELSGHKKIVGNRLQDDIGRM